jgi:hypothetical protein
MLRRQWCDCRCRTASPAFEHLDVGAPSSARLTCRNVAASLPRTSTQVNFGVHGPDGGLGPDNPISRRHSQSPALATRSSLAAPRSVSMLLSERLQLKDLILGVVVAYVARVTSKPSVVASELTE